jgi:BAI1-associated protein 3
MSTFSLPQLIKGGGLSKNHLMNRKHGTMTRIDQVSHNNFNGIKRRSMTRRGSLHRNQFRGVHKAELEREAGLIIHSMTVCFDLIWFLCGFLKFR